MHFILDGQQVREEADLFRWANWLEAHNTERTVRKTEIGDAQISTVFLSLNHNFDLSKPPILWETLVFGGEHDGDGERCSGTWQDAEIMHARMIVKIADADSLKYE